MAVTLEVHVYIPNNEVVRHAKIAGRVGCFVLILRPSYGHKTVVRTKGLRGEEPAL